MSFSRWLDDGIFAPLMDMVGMAWGVAWYGMAAVPIFLMLTTKLVWYAMGKYEGGKLKSEFTKLMSTSLLLMVGFAGMPLTEYMVSLFNTELQNTVADAPKRMKEAMKVKASDEAKAFIEKLEQMNASADDPQVDKFLNSLSFHSKAILSQQVDSEASRQSKQLSQEEISEIRQLISKSGVKDRVLLNDDLKDDFKKLTNTSDGLARVEALQNLNPDELMEQVSDMDFGLFSGNFIPNVLTFLLLLVGALFKIVIVFMRGALVFIFWMAFPIVVALSFVPTMEDTVKEWWNSFKPILLLTVTLTLIEAIANMVMMHNLAEGNVGGITNALAALVVGIMYLMSPQISVMLFGGGSAVAGLGQATTTGGMAMYGGATLVKGALFGGKDKLGNQKSGLIGTIGKGIKTAMNNRGGGAPVK
jgi:hypothetical protein